mmetsp:Transcript_4564/g.9929  ORF Transcript_4564/g.9929 Transcript_4564/m.9929 type:complete len:287 (-) Transcript_4564:519-1379(-)
MQSVQLLASFLCSSLSLVASATTTVAPAWGCYDQSVHRCACDTDQASCEAASHIWTDGCNSCRPQASSTTEDPDPVWGCYDQMDTHRCDCTANQAACDAKGHTWTDRCTSCTRPECNKDLSWGCFDVQAHSCECVISENECEQRLSSEAYWTHECWSCCHHSEWGCNVHEGHQDAGCNCDVTEGECAFMFGMSATWTHECHVCADREPVVEAAAAASDDDDDKTVVWVLIAVAGAVVSIVAASVAVVCAKRRSSDKTSGSSSGGGNGSVAESVVVGQPVSSAKGDV